MYTFIEASKVLGVTRQTLYNKKQLLASKGYLEFKNDVLYITNEGINFMREQYIPSINKNKIHIKNKTTSDKTTLSEQKAKISNDLLDIQRELYQEQINFLKSQLERSEQKNNELLEMLKQKDILISQISNSFLPASKKSFSFFKKKNVN